MLRPLVLFALAVPLNALRPQDVPAGVTYSGKSRPSVTVPRITDDPTVDGLLSEATWQQAARLTGFSQYQPVDGLPAVEETEVRVMYSPRAIYFGVVARAKSRGAVNATLSKRDNIDNDDRVSIFLDTFNDRRRAFIFGVNALGVQLDGVRTEGAASAASMFGGSIDFSPDFQFDSKGRVSDSGYVVEVRIPFKSLRFPASGPQVWGINVQRNSPSAGTTDTWTDARLASNSFLQQSGSLVGIEDVERGVVTEVQPFVTSSYGGARSVATGSFDRDDPTAKAGANLHFGFPALALDGTINPDFSQVEADVGLVRVNERFDLFTPEKRPFFLEGIELFATPNQLVYTRRIESPVAGGKVTGKLGPIGIAHLTALDRVPGSDALFNVTRLRTDFGGNSVAGVTLTDRRRLHESNTVAAADARYVFQKLYYLEGQVGGSWTKPNDNARTLSAPIWKTEFDRTGHIWGFNYLVAGIGDEFRSDAGFVPRVGYQTAHGFNRLAWYGTETSLMQSIFAFGGPTRIWNTGDLFSGRAIEGNDMVSVFGTLRGGWGFNGEANRDFFALDPVFAGGLQTRADDGTLVPYTGLSRLSGLYSGSLGFNTPTWRTFDFDATAAWGDAPLFGELAKGRLSQLSANLGVRPNPSTRVEARAVLVRLNRARDGSEYSRTWLPRLKLEYQPTRALFFRVVSEYRSERLAAPRDATTGAPLYLSDGTLAAARRLAELRTDWLVSFEPNPGTVAFFGYGSTMDRPYGEGTTSLRREADGFFVKLAYLFRR